MKISEFFLGALFVLCLPLLAHSETHSITLDQPQTQHSAAAFGSYLFGMGNHDENTGIWPCNFWSNFDARGFSDDIDRLKLEGGNSAILLFPFFDVSDHVAPTASRLDQLRQILDLCEARGIGLTLRLGYSWDNGFSNATHQQQIALLINPTQRKLWYRYCEETYALASRYHCFRGGFVCWEDFWGFLSGASLPPEERKKWAAYIHYPRDTVPERNDAAMEEYFDYYDQVFSDDFFASSQRYFPHLGMEVRMDDDPIFKNGVAIKSFVHRKMFAAANLSAVYLYWGPFMGALNEGDLISADTALRLLQNALDKARSLSAPGAQLIISQFNYKDNTPGFSRNSRIAPDQLADFMHRCSPILRQQCTGVYTWSTTSYYHNAINNGTFASGSAFWEFKDALVGIDEGRPCVTVFPGGTIRQRIEPNTALCAGLIGCASARIEFSAKVATDTTGLVSLGGVATKVMLTGKGGWRRYGVDFAKPDIASQTLSLSMPTGALMQDIVLANHKQEMGPEDPNFTRDVMYANLAWELSRGQEIPARPRALSGVTSDNWIISQATFSAPVQAGLYHLTIDLTVPDFVPDQSVRVSIQPDTFPRPVLDLAPGVQRLEIAGKSADQQVILTLTFAHGQRPPGKSADTRELSAHVDAVGP